MITIDNQKLVTIQEYAKSMNRTRQTIYNWLKDKKIKSKKIGFQQFIIVD